MLVGRIAAFDIHLKGLRRIVDDWQGLDSLRFIAIHGPVYRGYKDNRLSDQWLIVDSLNSFWVYLMQIYEPQDFEQEGGPSDFPVAPQRPCEANNVALDGAPSGITQLISEQLLSGPVVQLISSIAAEGSVDGPQVSRSDYHRPEDIAHQQCLEQITFLLAGPHLTTTDLLMCTGILFEVLHLSSVGKFMGPYERMVVVQSRRILRIERYLESPAQRECFVYVLVVLFRAMTSAIWATKPETSTLLSTMMEKIVPLTSLGRLEPALRKFCSSDAQFLRIWEPYQAIRGTMR